MSPFLKVGATVYGLLVTALCYNVTCEVSETTMLQKRASRRPGTNRSPNTEELLQHALEQEEKLKEIVGRLFHRLERAGMHVDIDTIDADAEVPILGSRKIRNKDLFETCRAPQALMQTAHVVPSQRRDSQTKLSCSSGLPIFDLSQGDYVCCPTAALYCAGCFQLDGSSCAQCSPGFVEVAGEGRCEACVDTPGWTNLDGENCIQAVCSDTAYYGLSSKQACCGCGGGQRAATPFTYYVAPTVLYATSITGFPVPRTAIHYTINEDCKLLEHGLAIDGATGSLQIAPGADKVGRNLLEAFSISCTIVAHQTSSLSASATLTVVAQKSISYGQYPLLFRTDVTNRYDPVVMGDWSFDQLNCDPSDSTAELRLGQRGRVRWPNPDKAASAGGVLADGFDMRGAICRVRGTSTPITTVLAQLDEGTGQFPPPVETVISYFVAVLPSVWENLRYERARTILGRLQVTVGQVAATVNVEVPDQAIRLLPPTAFTGKCSSDNGGIVTLDTVTGQGTYQGFPFFDMDLTTGSVRLAPSQELASLMPTDAGARAALTVSCTIYGLYQFPPFGDGPVLQEVIYLGATDDTCFVPKTGNYYFLEQRSLTVSGPTQCRNECRKDSTCTYYSFLSSTSCSLYKGLCPDAATPGCSQASGSVFARVLGCAERTTCIQLGLSKHFLSGRYCYYGENNYRGGLVFLKEGITSFESFWLHRKSRDEDVWVLQKPAQGDFYNASAAYMTFSGEEMGTIDSGIDLIADVFNQGTVTFPVTYSAGGSDSLTAAVELLRCDAPNLTQSEANDRAETADGAVAVMVDDPLTEIPFDYWLHPCHCAPHLWGQNDPVTAEAFGEIPAGSRNVFRPRPFPILTGQFACGVKAEDLLQVIVESDVQAADLEECQAQCAKKSECRYFFAGEVLSAKQCRLYSSCEFLYRELGLSGSLYSYPKDTEVCAIANPDACWHITRRRQNLGAFYSSAELYLPDCLDQALFEQCDEALFVGGVGVEVCEPCKFAVVPAEGTAQRQALSKSLFRSSYAHGTLLKATCWSERYSSLPRTNFEQICANGKWLDRDGADGLSRFSCVALVQVVSSYYQDLDSRNWQELYFFEGFKVHIALARAGFAGAGEQVLGDFYVKQKPTGAPQERQFVSATDESHCLSTASGSLNLAPCDGSSEQLLDGNTVASLFSESYNTNQQRKVEGPPDATAATLFDVSANLDCNAGSFGSTLNRIEFTRTRIIGSCIGATTGQRREPVEIELSFEIVHSRWQKCIAAVPCQPGSQDLPDCIANELQDCDGREDQAFKASTSIIGTALLNRGQQLKYVNLAAENFCCAWRLPDSGTYDGWLGAFYLNATDVFKVAVLSSEEGNGISSTSYSLPERPFDLSEPPTLEKTWYKSSTLQGNEINCVCDAGMLMQAFNKSTLLVTFLCVEVPNLGACTEETSVQQTIDGSTSQIDVDCGKDRGLQAIQAETDSKSRWTNFRFRCCQITANPVRMTKFGSGRVPPDPAEQGIYDAVARDDFGRPEFSGRDWSGQAAGFLSHNADTGQWCVSPGDGTRDCVSSDLVNPLDQQLGGENWQVVPVSDFDAKFEAFGAKLPKRFQSKRKIPPQLTFAAEDPAYAPECKEESDPGSEKFEQTTMNEVAKELKDTDNPCGLVFSTPKTKKKKTGLPPDSFFGIPDINGFGDVFGSDIDNEGEGMSYYAWNLDDVDGPGASGLTPKTVNECASREIKRDFELAQWEREYQMWEERLEKLEKIEAPLAALPEVQVGVFGVGITIKTGKIASNVVKAFRRASTLNNEMRLWARDSRFATADNEDCNSLQQGLARIFCDLHCVRDAVKKGDAAILTSLEEGVSVLQREMRNLFQAFVPDSSQSASLLAASHHEDFQQMRAGLATDVREMRQLLQRNLHPTAQIASQRALRAFQSAVQGWGGNMTSSASMLVEETARLKATLQASARIQTSGAVATERKTAAFVATMNEVLRAKTRTLGIYHAGASKSRQRQSTLYKGVQDELRELSFKATLRAMDASWWDLRRQLDRYLDSYDAYLRSFQHAVGLLDVYTRCGANFAQLKAAYTSSSRAHAAEQRTLREVWAAAAAAIGHMAAQVVDTGMLQELAAHDAVAAPQGEPAQLCRNATSFVEAATAAVRKGFFGQTVRQLDTLLTEMALLRQRFEAPPGQELFDSIDRLAAAAEAVSAEGTARESWVRWRRMNCVSERLARGKTANKIIQFQRLESSDSYDSTDGSTSTLPPWVGNLEQQHEEVMENQSFLEKQQQEVLESQAVQNQSIEKNSAGVQQLLASIVPGPLGPPIATPPPGPCVPGVELTEQVCQESHAPCTLTISNNRSRAASQTTIFPGCHFFDNESQELFKYCNDASGYRVVTASTCSEEPSFDAMLSAFLSYSGTCQLVGCVNDNGGRCKIPWNGTGSDTRATVTFTVAPSACVYIVQQPASTSNRFSNKTEPLIITSEMVLIPTTTTVTDASTSTLTTISASTVTSTPDVTTSLVPASTTTIVPETTTTTTPWKSKCPCADWCIWVPPYSMKWVPLCTGCPRCWGCPPWCRRQLLEVRSEEMGADGGPIAMPGLSGSDH